MLFNSFSFILLFLPVSILGFVLVRQYQPLQDMRYSWGWLFAASLFFYGYWNPVYLFLICGSIAINFLIGRFLCLWDQKDTLKDYRRSLLYFGGFINLFLIGYFKYANFFVSNIMPLMGSSFTLETIVLPLAISFFTFQQIAYLVEMYRQPHYENSFLKYGFFVTFFPQLIAGPIVRYEDISHQVDSSKTFKVTNSSLVVGLSIFALGLFKKTVLADSISPYANYVFTQAHNGGQIDFFLGWAGALSYTFQLYFDFSGYSDMAIGLGRIFGLKIPVNFNSPYKSTSIIDFWRRWHITLSTFLRDFLYIPLGGNKKGPSRRLLNLLMTMLLGGLWHGAGWTFVVWGGMHGLYLVVNHGWLSFRQCRPYRSTVVTKSIAWCLTFLCIVVAWVVFRATTLSDALMILKGMSGFSSFESLNIPLVGGDKKLFIILGFYGFVAFFLKNSQEFFGPYYSETKEELVFSRKESWLTWQPTPLWAFVMGVVATIALLCATRINEFIYFNF